MDHLRYLMTWQRNVTSPSGQILPHVNTSVLTARPMLLRLRVHFGTRPREGQLSESVSQERLMTQSGRTNTKVCLNPGVDPFSLADPTVCRFPLSPSPFCHITQPIHSI